MKDGRLILAVEAQRLNEAASLVGSFVAMSHVSQLVTGDTESVDGGTLGQFLQNQGVWFGPRKSLEDMPEFRQIIPHVVLHQDGKFLTFRRGGSGGEARLYGKLAIGFGGHIDLADAVCNIDGTINVAETIAKAIGRELVEEIGLVTKIGFMEPMGLIVTSEAPVDCVHVGVGLLLEVAGQIHSAEASQEALTWMTLDEIEAVPADEQETWTRIEVAQLRGFMEQRRGEPEVELVGGIALN